MLEVVEQEQRLSLTELFQIADACDARYRRPHQLRGRERRERHEEHAAGEAVEELCADLQAESRLAAASRAGQRDQPFRVREQRGQLGELLLPADERVR